MNTELGFGIIIINTELGSGIRAYGNTPLYYLTLCCVYLVYMYKRKSIRLKEYDYSQIGYYYVTICTLDRAQLFGRIIDNKMILNKYGLIAQNEWKSTQYIRQNVELDEFIIMPDHIHGIIIINDRRGVMPYALKNNLHSNNNKIPNDNKPINSELGSGIRAYGNTPLPFTENVRNVVTSNKYDGNTPLRSPMQTIGSIIRGYKSAVTININKIRQTPKTKIWQRNYFEHVIRNQIELDKTRLYIKNNPIYPKF